MTFNAGVPTTIVNGDVRPRVRIQGLDASPLHSPGESFNRLGNSSGDIDAPGPDRTVCRFG